MTARERKGKSHLRNKTTGETNRKAGHESKAGDGSDRKEGRL